MINHVFFEPSVWPFVGNLPNGKGAGHTKRPSKGKPAGGDPAKPHSPAPNINWQLGVQGYLHEDFLEVNLLISI